MSTSNFATADGGASGPLIVLVNGAWHGAWCWQSLQVELAKRGHASATVEPDGFGGLAGASPSAYYDRPFDRSAFATERSAVADLTLAHVRDTLVKDIRTLGRGRPVVALAHSISGFVVSAAVEAHPDLFDALIYLAAITPLHDLRASAYNVEPEMNASLLIDGLVGDPSVIGAARCDFNGNAAWTRRVFYDDAPVGQQRRAIAMLAADVPFGIDGTVHATAAGLGSVPRAYIHTLDDHAIPLTMQHRIVGEIDQACGGRTLTRSLATSHSPFLSRPAQLADQVSDIVASLRTVSGGR